MFLLKRSNVFRDSGRVQYACVGGAKLFRFTQSI